MAQSKLPEFDKYYHYMESVQSPGEDAKFLRQVYKESRGSQPKDLVLREDFCGTFGLCCEWVKLGTEYQAYGIDLDPEPLQYGRENYLPKLKSEQQKRVTLMKNNVMSRKLPPADIICALNFSYFIIKDRQLLQRYFRSCLNTLKDKGLLVLDCFGGSKSYEANEEETEFVEKGFSYFWDQDSFDPVTNESLFHIHYKRKGERKREQVFTYDWRMWTIPELRDVLLDAGFKDVRIYWEGTTEDGEGDGNYSLVTRGEECESWVSYIVAMA